MTKEEIISRLIENHKIFTTLISGMNDEDFMYVPENKWTAGQQLEHIYLSVRPLNLIFLLPEFLIRAYFGKANRHSRNYDALVQKYKTRLETNYKAGKQFLPKPVQLTDKSRLTANLTNLVAGLTGKLGKFSEEQLDRMIIPHPLLGKLTVREMMYFTIYHVEHHQTLTLRNLEARKKR